MSTKFGIPEKFYKGNYHPYAFTVKELRAILSELPDDLPIRFGSGVAMECIVYNVNSGDTYLGFSEVWDE